MAHSSENSRRLDAHTNVFWKLQQLEDYGDKTNKVCLIRFPYGRTDIDATRSQAAFQKISDFCSRLGDQSTICILTTSPDAARLQLYLESSLRFQLWVAVKTPPSLDKVKPGRLPERHAALLVLTRYRGSLRHTKTRIAYTYCPACGKTTKDYGGKKHVYHEYGTLMSDVWRDIEVDPRKDIDLLTDRLCDLFGVEPYTTLEVIDLSKCTDLASKAAKGVKEQRTLFEFSEPAPESDSQLIQGDCLEVLKSLPDESVDFCFADPPYNLQKRYDGYNDALELKEYFNWCDQWVYELARVLKRGRTCAILNIPLWTIRHYQYLASILNYQAWIVWEALGLPVRMIMPSHYSILCFSKGEPRPLPDFKNYDRESLEEESSALSDC